MAENKKSIVVYSDWIKKFEALTDDEAGRLIKHFFRYVNDFNPIAPDRITELTFIDIEACLKRDLVKWEKRAERSRDNGSKGGRPKNPEKPTETQQVILEPRKPDSVSVNDSVSVTVSGSVKKNKRTASRFTAPSEIEVVEYFIEKGYKKETGVKAYNYYVVADWHDSHGNKVRNWKQKMQAIWFTDENKTVSTQAKMVY